MENKNITILWLDDQREPYSYFKKKKTDSGAWVRNNDFYQENIFNNYKPNFIWVKNLPEFSEYIIENGLPDLVSFDHDLSSKTVKCDHNGADCARWLVNYCKENGLQMPKCFAHTANNKQRPILNDILGLNESIILESCDYVFNDEGQKCNSTGTVWKGVEYAKNKKNVPKGIGAYPFIIHNGRLFASTTPNGHGDFLKTEVLPKTEYNGVMVNSLKQELSINNRHVSICGRLFPNVNSDGSSIMTIWNPKEHGLTDEKNISAVIKLLADYFKIEPSMIKYEIKSGQLIQPTYQATSEDVKNLLKHNREIAQMSGLKTIEQYDTPVNDKDIYTAYATKPYSTLKPREKEMFHNLRGQDTRGNEELRNHLMKHNPNFTQAQWNAMSTIGDSKIKKTNVITESQLRKIIKETILEYLRK